MQQHNCPVPLLFALGLRASGSWRTSLIQELFWLVQKEQALGHTILKRACYRHALKQRQLSCLCVGKCGETQYQGIGLHNNGLEHSAACTTVESGTLNKHITSQQRLHFQLIPVDLRGLDWMAVSGSFIKGELKKHDTAFYYLTQRLECCH